MKRKRMQRIRRLQQRLERWWRDRRTNHEILDWVWPKFFGLRKFVSLAYFDDPRGEAPIPGVFDECFNPMLAWKRELWRRWQTYSKLKRAYLLARYWWRISIGRIRHYWEFPIIRRLVFPMIRNLYPQIIAKDLVSVQPMMVGVDPGGKDYSAYTVFTRTEPDGELKIDDQGFTYWEPAKKPDDE